MTGAAINAAVTLLLGGGIAVLSAYVTAWHQRRLQREQIVLAELKKRQLDAIEKVMFSLVTADRTVRRYVGRMADKTATKSDAASVAEAVQDFAKTYQTCSVYFTETLLVSLQRLLHALDEVDLSIDWISGLPVDEQVDEGAFRRALMEARHILEKEVKPIKENLLAELRLLVGFLDSGREVKGAKDGGRFAVRTR